MPHAFVIFDLDGTLADSFPWFLGVLNTVAREFKFREVAEDDIEPLKGVPASAFEVISMPPLLP